MSTSSPDKGTSSDRLHAVLDSLVHSVITMDEHGMILDANAAVEAQLGYTWEELVGQNVTLLMPEPHASAHQRYVDRYLNTGERRIIGIGRRVQACRKDGSLLDISLAVSEAELDGKRIFAGVLRDITLEVEHERELLRQRDELAIQAHVNETIQTAKTPEDLLTGVLQALISLAELEVQSKVGVFLVDNIANKDSHSFEPSRMDGPKGLRLVKTLGSFSDEFLEREAWVPMGACLCGRAAESGDVVVSDNCFEDPRHEHRFSGMTAHGHYIIPLKSEGRVIGVIFLYTDPVPSWDEKRINLFETLGAQIGIALDRLWTMSELHSSREQLYLLSTQDSLTNLKNRRALLQILEEERNRAGRLQHSVGILLIDVDRFKGINDRYGHPVGDQVLVEIARRLGDTARPYDAVGRLGGEEFLIILPNTDTNTAALVAERMRTRIETPAIDCGDGLELAVTISLGVTSTHDRNQKAITDEGLIAEADTALYRAKDRGRNRIELAVFDN